MTTLVDILFRANTTQITAASGAVSNLSNQIPGASSAVDLLADAFDALANPVSAAIGLFAAAAIGAANLGFRAIEVADNLNDLSINTGKTLEDLQAIGSIAAKAGSDLGSMNDVFERVAKNMAKGDDETIKFNKALDYFGVSAKDASGHMKTQQQIAIEVAQAYSVTAESASKHAAAQEALGKSYQKVIAPLLDMTKLQEEANYLAETGALVDGNLARAADNYNDTIHDLGSAFKGLGNDVARIMLPTLQSLMDALKNSATNGGLLESAFNILKVAISGVQIPMQILINLFAAGDMAVQVMGKSLGGVATMLAALANRDFKAISSIWSDMKADINKTVADAEKSITNQFGATAVERGDDKPKDDMKDRGNNFKTTNDKHSTTVKIQKDQLDFYQKANLEMAKMYEGLVKEEQQAEKLTEVQKVQAKLGAEIYSNSRLTFLRELVLAQASLTDQKKEQALADKAIADIGNNSNKEVDAIRQAATNYGLSAQAIRQQVGELRIKQDIEARMAALNPTVEGYENRRNQILATGAQRIAAYRDELSRLNAVENSRFAKDFSIGIDREVESLDRQRRQRLMSTDAVMRENAVLRIQEQIRSEMATLGNSPADMARKVTLINLEADATDKVTAAMDRAKEAQGSWLYGAGTAFAKYTNDLNNIAGAVDQSFTRVFSGLEDALVKFVQTGKFNFKDLVNVMIQELIRLSVQASMSKVFSGISGAIGGAASSSSSSGWISAIIGAFGGAKAVGGDVQANTSYMVGENGPELLRMGPNSGSIVPTHQLANMNASGATQINNIYNTVTVQGGNTNDETGNAVIAKLQPMMQQIAKTELVAATRPGGLLNSMSIKGAS